MSGGGGNGSMSATSNFNLFGLNRKKGKNGPKWQKIVSYSVFQEPYPGIEITDFQAPDKISNTIKYLTDILNIHWTSYLGSQVETSPTCLPAKMYNGNF